MLNLIRMANVRANVFNFDAAKAVFVVTSQGFAQSNIDFNDTLRTSIDETIHGLLGKSVLHALQAHLKEHYDVVPDEVPYRLDTLFDVLENTLGVKNSRTIGRAIAKNFYSRIGLQFNPLNDYGLEDYLAHAKRTLELKIRPTASNRESI